MDAVTAVILSLLAALGMMYLVSAAAVIIFTRELSRTVTVVRAKDALTPARKYLGRLLPPGSRVIAVADDAEENSCAVSYCELAEEVRKSLERND